MIINMDARPENRDWLRIMARKHEKETGFQSAEAKATKKPGRAKKGGRK